MRSTDVKVQPLTTTYEHSYKNSIRKRFVLEILGILRVRILL